MVRPWPIRSEGNVAITIRNTLLLTPVAYVCEQPAGTYTRRNDINLNKRPVLKSCCRALSWFCPSRTSICAGYPSSDAQSNVGCPMITYGPLGFKSCLKQATSRPSRFIPVHSTPGDMAGVASEKYSLSSNQPCAMGQSGIHASGTRFTWKPFSFAKIESKDDWSPPRAPKPWNACLYVQVAALDSRRVRPWMSCQFAPCTLHRSTQECVAFHAYAQRTGAEIDWMDKQLQNVN